MNLRNVKSQITWKKNFLFLNCVTCVTSMTRDRERKCQRKKERWIRLLAARGTYTTKNSDLRRLMRCGCNKRLRSVKLSRALLYQYIPKLLLPFVGKEPRSRSSEKIARVHSALSVRFLRISRGNGQRPQFLVFSFLFFLIDISLRVICVIKLPVEVNREARVFREMI